MLHSMLHSMLGASRAVTGEHSQSSCGLNPRSFTVAMFSAYQIIGPVSESRSVVHVSCTALALRWMDRFERKLDLEMARMSTGGTGDIENQLQQFVHDNLRPNASFL